MTVARVTLTVLVVASGHGWSGVSAAPDDKPRCRGQAATIVGTLGEDDLRGTNGRDVIVGLAGNDRIDAGSGDDLVCGGDGRDRIRGGTGDDRLFGQLNGFRADRGGGMWYGDTLEGGPGDDLLVPGFDGRGNRYSGYEEISLAHSTMPVVADLSAPGRWATVTGDGNDRIRLGSKLRIIGSAHDDTLTGSSGSDHLIGGAGNDRLSGLAGRDSLDGGTSRPAARDDDLLDGGEGPDSIISSGGRDVMHGGPGTDQLATWGTLPVQLYGDEGNDDLQGVAVVESGYLLDGGPGRDTGQLRSAVADSYATECCPQGGTAGLDQVTGAWQVNFFAGRAADAAVTSAGSAVGLEVVHLGGEFAWTYSGTDGPDVVTSSYYFPLHATMLGGDDVVTSSIAADTIDGGEGHDVGFLITAKDTVTGLEKTYSFEDFRR